MPRADTTTLVSCGKPLGTTEVRIVDVTDAPREAGAGEVGEIWIRGRSKCLGYWRRPELSAAMFEARLPGEPNGAPTWLRSGDLGFVRDDELYVCGRVKDMLIVRGLNYYPQDIEAIVEEDPNVRKGCVAAFAHEADGRETLVVVAEAEESAITCLMPARSIGDCCRAWVWLRRRSSSSRRARFPRPARARSSATSRVSGGSRAGFAWSARSTQFSTRTADLGLPRAAVRTPGCIGSA